MKGFQKVIILGTLGRDPEVRYSPTGSAVCNLSMATSESWKDKQTGEPKEKTEWHRVVFFRRLAEVAGEYLTKGSQLLVEGRLQTRKWQDRDGNDRYTTEIIGDRLQMVGSKPSGGGGRQGSGQGAASSAQEPPAGMDFDDDIPFDVFQRGSVI